jgi:hypothetical protein
MQRFYILDGNFTTEYNELIPQGFKVCYDFFKDKLQHWNEKSDPIENLEDLEKLMKVYQDFLLKTKKKTWTYPLMGRPADFSSSHNLKV